MAGNLKLYHRRRQEWEMPKVGNEKPDGRQRKLSIEEGKKVNFMCNTGRKWKDGYIRFSKDKIVANEGRYLIRWIGKEMGFQ